VFWVVNRIVCDTVENAGGGKYRCLGIYPKGVLTVPDFVQPILVSFYVEINSFNTEEVEALFELEDRVMGKVFGTFRSNVRLNGDKTGPLFGGPYELAVQGPSFIHFSAIAGAQRVELATVQILAVSTA
jgi:hypothetical protein